MKIDFLAPSSSVSRRTIAIYNRANALEKKERTKSPPRKYKHLSYIQACDIREKYNDGTPIKALAISYNVSTTTIENVVSGKTHRRPNSKRKLTQEQADEIRLNPENKTQRKLALEYNVSLGVITDIIARKSYNE
jgi:DNA invertase Pin-like site-specific DNA recombinase